MWRGTHNYTNSMANNGENTTTVVDRLRNEWNRVLLLFDGSWYTAVGDYWLIYTYYCDQRSFWRIVEVVVCVYVCVNDSPTYFWTRWMISQNANNWDVQVKS